MGDGPAMNDLCALRLQVEWGVDEALGASPVVRLRTEAPPRLPAHGDVVPPAEPVEALTVVAGSLPELHAALAAFTGCGLRATATHTVRPSGNPDAGLVLIGEAPGSDDDRTGDAFAGVAGQQLDRILRSAGLDRTAALLTHLVPWRPPGNRVPTEAEVRACLPFLHRLLQIVQPKRLILLGQGPAKALLRTEEPVRRLRGRWHAAAIPGLVSPVPALCMAPPDQWLRSATSKRDTWSDMLSIQTDCVNPA